MLESVATSEEAFVMRLSRRTRIGIGIAAVVVAVSAWAAPNCIIDDLPMMWTGQTRTDGGKLLYVMKCLQGHYALALSPN